jgi:hypothetical protein
MTIPMKSPPTWSQLLLDWTMNSVASVPVPILTQTSNAFLAADFRKGTADFALPVDPTAHKTVPLIPDCNTLFSDGGSSGVWFEVTDDPTVPLPGHSIKPGRQRRRITPKTARKVSRKRMRKRLPRA